MLFEFDVGVFSLKLVPCFFFLGGGGIRYAKLQNAQLKFYSFSFSDTFLICFKKTHKKKVIKELKPKSVPKSKKYVGLSVIL